MREYTLGEEIFNAVTHGVGAGLAVAALVLLIVKSVADGGGILLAAALVYGIAQLLEYLMSTLYHALAAERAKRVFKVLDHSRHLPAHRRYLHPLLPHHLGTCGRHPGSPPSSGPSHLSASLCNAFWTYRPRWISAVLYVALGWSIVFFIPTLFAELAPAGFWLLGCRRHQLYRGRRVLHLQKGALHALDFSPVRAGRQLPAVLQRVFLRDLALQLLGVRGAQGGDFAAPAGKIVLRRFQEEGQIA